MKLIRITLLAAAICSLYSVASAVPGEVRIFDGRGVMRVVKAVHGQAQVTIKFKGRGPVDAALTNSVGLAPDVRGEMAGDGSIIFRDVGEGSWKIITHGGNLEINTVEVSEARG